MTVREAVVIVARHIRGGRLSRQELKRIARHGKPFQRRRIGRAVRRARRSTTPHSGD